MGSYILANIRKPVSDVEISIPLKGKWRNVREF